MVSSAQFGNLWFKDGVQLADTIKTIKPISAGFYTVNTTQNSCTSPLSASYYYLITDIINLSDNKFIKLAPNPFKNQLFIDFSINGRQLLNIEIFDIATGVKVETKQGVSPGTFVNLQHLSAGTYLIKVNTIDQKDTYSFKMVKM